ncbi:hypothetical protein SD77_2094 [Bacillus badius]|uniref:Uncharacterized protein n=1 Tax=Bacillus badius TaxID=1455 RepID=A0ABR5AY23_BACBA|nr:hypothetical protein SD77_2094 [Bacillus badius]
MTSSEKAEQFLLGRMRTIVSLGRRKAALSTARNLDHFVKNPVFS